MPGPEPPRRRPARNLPDLASLFEDADANAPAPAPDEAPETPTETSPEEALKGPREQPPAPETRHERLARASRGLSSLYNEEPEPAPAEPPAAGSRQERRARPTCDLAGLFVDEPKPVPTQPTEVSPPPVVHKPTETSPDRRARASRSLSALFDEEPKPAKPDEKTSPSTFLEGLGKSSTETGEEPSVGDRLAIPPELETYLSPDLWRRVNGPAPARGVLINALERLRSVLYLISAFLPGHLVQEKMRRPVPGLVSGQMLRGTLLFSDVSGFTALSERLAVLGDEGAEQLTNIMNSYFDKMLEILAWSGGILLKFAGDATLVYFPEQEGGKQAAWAVRAGLRMLRAMSQFAKIPAPSETVTLKMKVGIGTGEFLAASVGSPARMEYVVLGQAVAQTMGAESATTGPGQLVVNAATLPFLDDSFSTKEQKGGYYLVGTEGTAGLDDFEIKAEARRARGAIPWSASPQAIFAQIEVALRQVKALTPYLPAELVERIVVHASKRNVRSLFRTTTVMFGNFSGFEALLAMWGSEGVQRVTGLLNAYYNAMQDVIARYGGVVSRIDPYSKGTKLLVLFGTPVAHEDDDQRAVSAALAMNAELEALNDTWKRKYARHLPPDFNGPLVQHRVGLTHGQTYAGQVGSFTRREYTVMGDDVNLSARLMSAAGMGQVLISQFVNFHVQGYYVLTPLAPIKVKGKAKPIPIYQVEGPREDTLAMRMRERDRLVGREAELAQAEATLQAALQGSGRCLTIQGPAGIGKSHFADELLRRADALGMRLLFSQCRSFTAGALFAPWSALLRSLAGITTSDYRPEAHHAKLQRLIHSLRLPPGSARPLATLMGLKPLDTSGDSREGPVSDQAGEQDTDALIGMLKQGKTRRRGSSLEVIKQLDEPRSSEAGQAWQAIPDALTHREQEELFAAVWAVLENVARSGPTVIFFEDAQWMDERSKELLAFIKQRVCQVPLLFLVADRSNNEAGRAAQADAALAGAGRTGRARAGLDAVLGPGRAGLMKKRDDPGSAGEVVITLEPFNPEETNALVSYLLVSELSKIIYQQSSGNPMFVDEITHWFQRTHNINAAELSSVLESSNFLQKLVVSGLETLPEQQAEVARVASVVGNDFRTGEVQALTGLDPVTLSQHLHSLVQARLIQLAEAGPDSRYAFQQSMVRDILYNSLPFEQRRELHAKLAGYLSLPLTRRREAHARISAALDIGLASERRQDTEAEASQIAYHFEQADQWLLAAQNRLLAAAQARQAASFGKALSRYTQALADLDKLGAPADPELVSLRLQAALGQGDMALRHTDYLAALTSYEQARAVLPKDAAPQVALDVALRLALTQPLQGKAEEGETQLRIAIEGSAGTGHLPGSAAMAWLCVRLGRDDAAAWLARAQVLAGEHGLHALQGMLAGLAGDWEKAVTAYHTAGQAISAGLAEVRLGEQAAQEKCPLAMEHFLQAAGFLAGQTGSQAACAQALVLFREAEIEWRTGSTDEARSLLQRSLAALEGAHPILRGDARQAVQQALKLANTGKSRRWPVWDAQLLEDVMYVDILANLLK